MSNWFERAEGQIERAYECGEITLAEYKEQMRDLMAEMREAAQQAADDAYNDYMGGY